MNNTITNTYRNRNKNAKSLESTSSLMRNSKLKMPTVMDTTSVKKDTTFTINALKDRMSSTFNSTHGEKFLPTMHVPYPNPVKQNHMN